MGVLQDNLVLSTESILWIGHGKEIRKLTFRALARPRSEFLDSLRRRANVRNVSFRISLRWPIHIINPVNKTKLSWDIINSNVFLLNLCIEIWKGKKGSLIFYRCCQNLLCAFILSVARIGLTRDLMNLLRISNLITKGQFIFLSWQTLSIVIWKKH